VHGRIHRRTAEEWIADVRLYQGKFVEARQLLNKVAEDASARKARAAELTYLARIDALTGDAPQAREQAERAERASDDPATLVDVAEVLAMAGAREESLASLSKWKSTKQAQADPQASARESFVRGANSLSSGLTQKAIADLMLAVGDQEKPDLEAEYLLARAYIANGQCAEATKHLDRVIQAKGPLFLDDVPSIWPLAHYDMAECYRKLGADAKAASNYRIFLDVWKDADPGIKQVDIAKRWLEAQPDEKSRKPRPRPKH
jgi:tetratricopeptide (TPR) repeat protein